MINLYFVCMGNYYRSRLAEELAIHYGEQYGLELAADSGGLSKRMPVPSNPGPISSGTMIYLQAKGIHPRHAERLPKRCNPEDIAKADIVICTDAEEQRDLFIAEFPNHGGKLICWNAHDIHLDPMIRTPEIIDRKVEELIQDLLRQ